MYIGVIWVVVVGAHGLLDDTVCAVHVSTSCPEMILHGVLSAASSPLPIVCISSRPIVDRCVVGVETSRRYPMCTQIRSIRDRVLVAHIPPWNTWSREEGIHTLLVVVCCCLERVGEMT